MANQSADTINSCSMSRNITNIIAGTDRTICPQHTSNASRILLRASDFARVYIATIPAVVYGGATIGHSGYTAHTKVPAIDIRTLCCRYARMIYTALNGSVLRRRGNLRIPTDNTADKSSSRVICLNNATATLTVANDCTLIISTDHSCINYML